MFGYELRASAAGDCGPPIAARLIRCEKAPQPSGGACDVKEQPSAGGGRLRAAAPIRAQFRIQDSKFRIKWSSQASLAVCSVSGCSLRRARTSGLADASSGPSRGEAAARCGSIRNRKFRIQYSKLSKSFGHIWAYILCRAAACGAHAGSATNCGLPPGGGCGPHGPDGPISNSGQARSRAVGLHERTCGTRNAALRPGAAAGCRSLCDRS